MSEDLIPAISSPDFSYFSRNASKAHYRQPEETVSFLSLCELCRLGLEVRITSLIALLTQKVGTN